MNKGVLLFEQQASFFFLLRNGIPTMVHSVVSHNVDISNMIAVIGCTRARNQTNNTLFKNHSKQRHKIFLGHKSVTIIATFIFIHVTSRTCNENVTFVTHSPKTGLLMLLLRERIQFRLWEVKLQEHFFCFFTKSLKFMFRDQSCTLFSQRTILFPAVVCLLSQKTSFCAESLEADINLNHIYKYF